MDLVVRHSYVHKQKLLNPQNAPFYVQLHMFYLRIQQGSTIMTDLPQIGSYSMNIDGWSC